MNIVRSTVLIGCVCLLGCGSNDRDTEQAEPSEHAADSGTKPEPRAGSAAMPATSPSNAVEEPTDERASHAAFAGSFDACVAALKPVCGYDEKATPCASLRTP